MDRSREGTCDATYGKGGRAEELPGDFFEEGTVNLREREKERKKERNTNIIRKSLDDDDVDTERTSSCCC